ncbi:auxin efflux carrier [Guyanagaster necrorhizus]|uniref:Auxin efflux carrier n=1 Tax=Guyanagaster necrorhizus TaxID=856835 RepID=A0A9P8AN46_9AGAR|nr:auxin efflux carrier [Guyanagaster necrorhizus MCA 3950]KAG7441381.1 auxin efflux carrier [Guyanagaster necrorhizus MCA 3950]
MVSAGALVWISLRPLLRLVMCVTGGYAITKADIFPRVAAQGAGQIALNITIPCLMFSKMVPAFTSDNIGALGPLLLICVIYQALSVGIAWLTKQFFWVPHRFRYGILVAGGWANYGDIPTAVIMSITGASPFNGDSDQNLSVAYISVFILYYMMTFFPMGGNKVIAWDFKGPDVEPEEVKESVRLRRQFIFRGWPRALRQALLCRCQAHDEPDAENQTDEKMPSKTDLAADDDNDIHHHPRHGRHVSFSEETSSTAVLTDVDFTSAPPTEKLHSPQPSQTATQTLPYDGCGSRPLTPIAEDHPPSPSPVRRRWQKFCITARGVLKSLLTPASITILISFPIALIKPLKALFVEVDGYYMPSAPDGEPPLAFVTDFAEFMGAASVPLGLICLGSALARLNVPRSQWPHLPLGAIFSLAVGRMLLMPVFGVLVCEGLVNAGVISRDDKVLRFVCILFSCLPTATTQVFVTQVYSGTGSAEHLSAFLIPQYILMFLSMTALSAYTLQMLF